MKEGIRRDQDGDLALPNCAVWHGVGDATEASFKIYSSAKGLAMRASINRIVFLVAFGLLSGLAGAYLAVQEVYDWVDAELPALLEYACLP